MKIKLYILVSYKLFHRINLIKHCSNQSNLVQIINFNTRGRGNPQIQNLRLRYLQEKSSRGFGESSGMQLLSAQLSKLSIVLRLT